MLISLISFAQDAPFITTWEVTNYTGLDITIPTTGDGYNYSIDFGDGTVLNNQTGDASHTYDAEGSYTVSISGEFPRIYFVGSSSDNRSKFKTIDQWGDIQWLSMEMAFEGCQYLNIEAQDIPDLNLVSNASNMFYGCENLIGNESMNSWDVSNIINMFSMFYNAEVFNQPLNNWDVSSVINMERLFANCFNFNQPLNNWDVSNVESMEGMFSNCNSFNQPLSNWNVSSVLTMKYMFSGGLNGNIFNQPLQNWDVSNVENMRGMFSMCSNFNQSLENWNVSNVTNMDEMFYKCYDFDQPLNNWDVSNVLDMYSMFYQATSFNQPLDNWNVSNVVGVTGNNGFSFMFNGAISFNQSLFNWDINLSNLYGFINNTNLDINNYNLLLQNLSTSNVHNGNLNAYGLEYCNENIRQYLINEMGWNIYGDTFSEECNNINGYIKFDINQDGCDDTDLNFSNQLINVTTNNYSFETFSISGFYNLNLIDENIEISLVNLPDFLEASPESNEIIFTEANQTIQQDFCLTATQTVEDLNITLLPITEARPGFEADYQLVIENMGTQTVSSANINLFFDDTKQSFVVATPSESSNSTNELTFEVNDLPPFGQQVFDFTMQTFQPPTVNGGDILAFTATVTPNTNDYTPEDNTFVYEQTVVNSYDPNDKQVLQGEEVHIDNADQYLNYLIRFQNTGTASAINVRVLDTLHPNLDYNTIRPVNASHDYQVQITDGNHVEFIFEDINLPDETSDEPGSHGFIAYKIKPKSNVAVGDFVTGDAQIYFDFNSPIITNMVSTQFIDDLSVNEYDKSRTISIYPNPTTGVLNIQKNTTLELKEINIYNLQGKKLLNFSENLDKINTEDLSSGIYLLQLQTSQGLISKQLIKN